MIKNIKEKTGVLVKILNEGEKEVEDEDTKQGWKVLVGGNAFPQVISRQGFD